MIKKIIKKLYRLLLSIKWRCNINPIIVDVFLKDYKIHKLPFSKIMHIHQKGFSVDDWIYTTVNESNYKTYMSNIQYYNLHPINGPYSKWIDDKLTLKYICYGTPLDRYMPEYYFLINENSQLYSLMNYDKKGNIAYTDVADLLLEKKVLAIKLISGAIGEGFIKAEYKNNVFYLNDRTMNYESFCKEISLLKNYIITQYFYPHKDLAEFCNDRINCTRVLLGRINGKMEIIKSYVRFGTNDSGFVENYAVGGVLCYLDKNGYFSQGNIMDKEKNCNVIIQYHPDNKKELKAQIPLWDEILKANELFDIHFPQMKYLGMDYVVTKDNEIKVLEINSLTSLDGLQFYGSILEEEEGIFFKKLLNK